MSDMAVAMQNLRLNAVLCRNLWPLVTTTRRPAVAQACARPPLPPCTNRRINLGDGRILDIDKGILPAPKETTLDSLRGGRYRRLADNELTRTTRQAIRRINALPRRNLHLVASTHPLALSLLIVALGDQQRTLFIRLNPLTHQFEVWKWIALT